MRPNYKRSQMGMLGGVLLLMAVTLYMAFAGPYTLFKLKQSETSEIKTVIVVARHGDEWPSSEAYFLGEPRSLQQEAHLAGQLTNVGKERMYLLGKFLKLRYYNRLLKGDPRRLRLRSAGSDKCLESAQLLAAGLNPPQAGWVWSLGNDHDLASRWQPKAVHTTDERTDDLLSSGSNCLLNYETSVASQAASQAWKNSNKYLQLLNEFRHDLQVLRQNTGLEFEDDLEMLVSIEEHLRARSALGNAPSWYTTTLAQRLAHIADVTSGCKFSQREVQRLYSGRLLDSIARNIFAQIHGPANNQQAFSIALTEDEDELERMEADMKTLGRSSGDSGDSGDSRAPETNETSTANGGNNRRAVQTSMSLYMTDRQHLTALLQALKIYSTQPHYGFLLIIELHYDPANKVHFLRLYTVNSLSHNTFPEPVRVNPIACPLDSVECSPEQFEQNIRHLSVDKRTWWQQLCKNQGATLPQGELGAELELPQSSQVVPSSTFKPATYTSADEHHFTMSTTSTQASNLIEKLDNSLIVGPTDVRPPAGELPVAPFEVKPIASEATSQNLTSIVEIEPKSSTTGKPELSAQANSTGEHSAQDGATQKTVDEPTSTTYTTPDGESPAEGTTETTTASLNTTTSEHQVDQVVMETIAPELNTNHLARDLYYVFD